MIAKCYLVVGHRRGYTSQVVVKRMTKSRPLLEAGEAVVHVSLDLPGELFDVPMVVVPVTIERVAVAVGVEPLDEDEDEL